MGDRRERLRRFFGLYAVVGRVDSRASRPVVWWAHRLRSIWNDPSITVDDVLTAMSSVPRIRVAPGGETNVLAGRTFSMIRGEGGR